MTATRTLVRQLREEARMRIDEDLEALILERLGNEPHPHTYTEQDLLEQVRKLVIDHNREHELPLDEVFPQSKEPKGGAL